MLRAGQLRPCVAAGGVRAFPVGGADRPFQAEDLYGRDERYIGKAQTGLSG